MGANIGAPKEKQCAYCGRMKPIGDYFPNFNKFMAHEKMVYCKQCTKEISTKIFDSNAHHITNTANMCAFFNMPYNEQCKDELQEVIAKKTKELDYVFEYLKLLQANTEVTKPQWNDLSGNTYFPINLLKRSSPTSEGDLDLLIELEKDWGKQTLKDYIELEETLLKYSNGETLTPSMHTTMKYLCLAELEVKRLKESKEDTSKAEEKVQKYFKSLKLDNYQFKDAQSVGERILEKWIAIEEQTNPIEVADELFAEDFCKIREDNDDLMRAMRNLVAGTREYPDLDVIADGR